MPGIKITGIRATPVNIPLEKPMWWTGGYYPGTSKTIIEVETDQGLVGLGEAPSVDVVGQIQAMGERLIGMDPLVRQIDNTVAVPEGPGLGVTLDRDALNIWHKHLLDNGPLDHFHDPQKPGVFRRLSLH